MAVKSLWVSPIRNLPLGRAACCFEIICINANEEISKITSNDVSPPWGSPKYFAVAHIHVIDIAKLTKHLCDTKTNFKIITLR